jgi:hypothetical protein
MQKMWMSLTGYKVMPNAHEENTALDNDASHAGNGVQISTSEIEIALI